MENGIPISEMLDKIKVAATQELLDCLARDFDGMVRLMITTNRAANRDDLISLMQRFFLTVSDWERRTKAQDTAPRRAVSVDEAAFEQALRREEPPPVPAFVKRNSRGAEGEDLR